MREFFRELWWECRAAGPIFWTVAGLQIIAVLTATTVYVHFIVKFW